MEPPEHARDRAPAGARDPFVGRLLEGRYRIAARVARGGMASVYEATDTRLDRTVAIKVMHPGLGDDDEFAQRFVREARAAARLNHPHVVGVYDQGNDDGTVFLAMEYVPGHTLRDVIRKEAPLPPARALALIEPVVSALAAAHRAGLVHRDVKPENVLLAGEEHGGSIKVADFGLAKAVSTETQHTATGGVLIGTVSYLAPELVVDGRSDARADVYAVGVVLFELLTGTKPHEGESPIQVAYKHVHHDVPPPSQLQPDVPDYVDALVARATSRDHSQRQADAGVLLHQIHLVSHALHEGSTSDADLVTDLAPRRPVVDDTEVTTSIDNDTTPEPFDAGALALLTQVGPAESGLYDDGAPDRTTALERHPAATSEQASTSQHSAMPPPDRLPARRAPSPAVPVTTFARGRSRRGPLLLVLALVLVAAVGAGAYWFGWARYTTTPGVLGIGEDAAVERLEGSGLEAQIDEPDYSENVPAGAVIATDPEPGAKVLDGGTVALTVSLGPERYEVPVLRGMSVDEATAALDPLKLEIGERTEKWSERIAEGGVLNTSPKRGTVLKPGAVVDLVVSKGRRPIPIRDWTGKSIDTAETYLSKRNLVADVTSEQYDDDVAAGAIISQSPTSGTLFRGDEVSFVVSKGPELVEVPRTVAMGEEAATERLEALGFEVEVEKSDNYIGVGFVFSTDPDAGEMVPKGSTITLYLI